MSRFVKWICGNVVVFIIAISFIVFLIYPLFILGDNLWRGVSRLNAVDYDEWSINNNLKKMGIVTGNDTKKLVQQFRRLKNLSAPNGAVRGVDFLHVVIIDTNQQFSKSSFFNTDDYVMAKLDLANMSNSALVLIADVPYVWQVKNASSVPIARLGFEGAVPFDIKNAKDGMIAGFKIASFGAWRTFSPSDFHLRDCFVQRRKICSSLRAWQQFFNLKDYSVRIWHLLNPQSISPSAEYLISDSSDQFAIGYINQMCERQMVLSNTRRCTYR